MIFSFSIALIINKYFKGTFSELKRLTSLNLNLTELREPCTRPPK